MKIKTLIKTIMIAGIVSLPVLTTAKVQGGADRPRNQLTDSMHQDTLANIVNRNQDNIGADPSRIFDEEWYKRITVTGVVEPILGTRFGQRPVNGINPDPFTIGDKRTLSGSGAASQSLGLNAAELYVDAQVTDYLLTHLSLAFDTSYFDAGSFSRGRDGQTQPQTVFVEEASATVANFEKSPLWLTVGRQFLLFGSMQHNAVTSPMTQTLSSANNVAVTAGYVSDLGFNMDVYGFQGPQRSTGSSVLGGFGGNIGIAKTIEQTALNVNLGVINNMNNNYLVANSSWGSPDANHYKKVPGLSLHFDISSGPFQFLADYVLALTKFNPLDLPVGTGTSTNSSAPPALGPGPGADGAKPWAYALETKYDFKTSIMDSAYDSKVFAGFQQSGNAVAVQNANILGGYWMPHYRYLAGYGINVVKNFQIRFQYSHDVDYKINKGGSGKSNDTIYTDLKFLF